MIKHNLLNYYIQDLDNKNLDLYNEILHIKKYAEQSDSIVEMGVRDVHSTIPMILSNPNKMISLDLFDPSHYSAAERMECVTDYAKTNNIDYQFIIGSSLEYELKDNFDMLFIDTLHRYSILKEELNRHHKKINKFIILHDTINNAYVNEADYFETEQKYNLTSDKVGLMCAILEFLLENQEWKIKEFTTIGSGLMVLIRI